MVFQKMISYIKRKNKNFKILFIGLDNSGKSTIINSLFNTENSIGACPPTFGFRIFSVEYQSQKLDILDIGGQTMFQAYWNNYFEKTDGIVFLVDSTDNRDISSYLNQLLALSVPIAIFFNKVDLNREFEIPEIFNELPDVRAFKTSVYDKTSICSGFDWLISRLKLSD